MLKWECELIEYIGGGILKKGGGACGRQVAWKDENFKL